MFKGTSVATVARDGNWPIFIDWIHTMTWGEPWIVPCVLQFRPGETRPALTLGQRFRPGGGRARLCQPTAVAVATSGQVFVADGYCNHRVLTFSQRGHLLRLIPLPSGEIKSCFHAPYTPVWFCACAPGESSSTFSLHYVMGQCGRTL
jgi:hypothetical protein